MIDGFWRQEDEISLELIKVARDELDFRQRHKAQVHLYHVIHRFLIKECSDFPAVFLIRPAEGIVDAPVLLVDPVKLVSADIGRQLLFYVPVHEKLPARFSFRF